MRKKIENDVISIQVNGRWRKIGKIKDDKLIIELDYLEHYSRLNEGYGFYRKLMKDESIPEMIEVRIRYKSTVTTYNLSREDISKNGKSLLKTPVLIFLSLDKMKSLNKI